MSCEFGKHIDFKILVTFSDQFENDRSIFLFFSIFVDEEVIDDWFGSGSVDGHVDYYFIGHFSFFFELNRKGGENGLLFPFFEILFDG